MQVDSDSALQAIRALLESQDYAILCTHGETQAYGSLVAFAFSEDLRQLVFATPTSTRKYRLMSENAGVALVVDNRAQQGNDLMRIDAVTITGVAEELAENTARDRWSQALCERHPHLAPFVRPPTCAIFGSMSPALFWCNDSKK